MVIKFELKCLVYYKTKECRRVKMKNHCGVKTMKERLNNQGTLIQWIVTNSDWHTKLKSKIIKLN